MLALTSLLRCDITHQRALFRALTERIKGLFFATLLHKLILSAAITDAAAIQISLLLTLIAIIYDANQTEHEKMSQSMILLAGY